MATVRGRDRAQLALIGALALAVILVAIALVLNSAIYTHNLASRYDSQSDDAGAFVNDALVGAGGAMDQANREHAEDGYTAIENNYLEGLANVSESLSRGVAADGLDSRVAHVPDSAVEGVWIADDDPAGSTFEPATSLPSGVNSWVVAEDVTARNFQMRVDGSSLSSDVNDDPRNVIDNPSTTSGFLVKISDGSRTWWVAPYDPGSGVNLMVHDESAGTYETCAGGQTTGYVDVTGAELNGHFCEPLDLMRDLSGTYTITYYNGSLVNGGYELVVDRVVDDETDETGPFTDAVDAANYGNHCGNDVDLDDEWTYYSGTSGQYPRVSPVIYAAFIDTNYEGTQITFGSTSRVAPEEPTGPAEFPRITSFTVTDNTGSDQEFVVDWTVTDPTADPSGDDLGSVTVELVGVDSRSPSVDGDTESGTTTLPVTSGETYDVRITVTDDSSDSRSVTQRHVADGDATGCPP